MCPDIMVMIILIIIIVFSNNTYNHKVVLIDSGQQDVDNQR